MIWTRTLVVVTMCLLFFYPKLASNARDIVITLPPVTITAYRIGISYFKVGTGPVSHLIQHPDYQRIGIVLGPDPRTLTDARHVNFVAWYSTAPRLPQPIYLSAHAIPGVPVDLSNGTWTDFEGHTGIGSSFSTNVSQIRDGVLATFRDVEAVREQVSTLVFSRNVSITDQRSWAVQHPRIALQVLEYSKEADRIAPDVAKRRGWSDALHNGRSDAFHHAYWHALMASDRQIRKSLAISAGEAHERDNLNHGTSAPQNESVMDLMNNSVGADIGESLPGASASIAGSARLQETVAAAVIDGKMFILDDVSNLMNLAVIQPSDK